MNIELMKFVDRYIGIPACAALTLWDQMVSLIRKPKILGGPKKILFLKPAEMGTSVILYPVIQRAKEMYPDAEIYFAAFEENISIFEVLGIIKKENIFILRTNSVVNMMADTLRVLRKLRELRVDTVIDLEFFARYTALFSYLTGASRRVGFHRFNFEGLYRGNLMTHKVPFNYYLHVGQSFMSLLLALKSPGGRTALKEPMPFDQLKNPQVPLGSSAKTNILNKLKTRNPSISERSKFVIISPNTGEWLPYRKWPIEHYTTLCEKLFTYNPDLFVVVTGTKLAVQDAAYLADHLKSKRLIDLTCQTTLSEFIDLLNIGKVIISVDSGPAHFACLTNIGIVCIFGPDTRTVFAPLSPKAVSIECGLSCHPCFSPFNSRTPNCDEADKACLRSITVESVFKEAIKFL